VISFPERCLERDTPFISSPATLNYWLIISASLVRFYPCALFFLPLLCLGVLRATTLRCLDRPLILRCWFSASIRFSLPFYGVKLSSVRPPLYSALSRPFTPHFSKGRRSPSRSLLPPHAFLPPGLFPAPHLSFLSLASRSRRTHHVEVFVRTVCFIQSPLWEVGAFIFFFVLGAHGMCFLHSLFAPRPPLDIFPLLPRATSPPRFVRPRRLPTYLTLPTEPGRPLPSPQIPHL